MKQFDIDHFIKNKIDEKLYAFDESAWVDAQKMIAFKSKRRRRLIVLFWFLLFLVVSIVMMLIYYPSNSLKINTIDNSITGVTHLELNNKINTTNDLIDNRINAYRNEVVNQELDIRQNDIKIARDSYTKSHNTKINKSDLYKNRNNQDVGNNKKNTTENLIVSELDYKDNIDDKEIGHHSRIAIGEKLAAPHLGPLNIVRTLPTISLSMTMEKNKKQKSALYLLYLMGVGIRQESQHLQIGLQGDIVLNSKLTVNMGLGYHWARANNLPAHRGNLAIYDNLSKTFYSSSIEANQFNYLRTQLSLSYFLNKNHKISVGGSYRFLVLTRGTIRKENQKAYNTWIVETGLNRSFFAASVDYSYAFSKKWSLCVATELMLSNVFGEEIPYSSNLSNFQMGIKYRLL